MIYVAMFDEVNEGTAIFIVTDNPPIGDKVSFLSVEGPSDLYLWLTGEAANMLRGQIPLSLTMPQRNGDSPGK